MNIFKAMKPEKVYENLVQMPWDKFASEGIKTALLDFDNTLGPDHATEPEEYSYKCVKMIEEHGIRCCLVSNAKSGRSAKIAEMLGIPVVTYANKYHFRKPRCCMNGIASLRRVNRFGVNKAEKKSLTIRELSSIII